MEIKFITSVDKIIEKAERKIGETMANKPENHKEMMEESTAVMNNLNKFIDSASVDQLKQLSRLLAGGQDAQSVEIARQIAEFGYIKYKDMLPKHNISRYVEQDYISDFAKKKLDDLDGTVIRWPLKE